MDATKITTVELTEVDLAHARQILFGELRDAAKVLAEKAEHAAYDGNADEDNLAGDDAHAQYRHRVQAIAQLLDQLGWSVLTDMATIVEHERSRKQADRVHLDRPAAPVIGGLSEGCAPDARQEDGAA